MNATQEELRKSLQDAAEKHAGARKKLQDAALDEVFFREHKAVAQTSGGLVHAMNELSTRAGLPVAPRLYITPTFPSFYGGPNAGGAGLPGGLGGLVVLNEPLLKAFNYKPGPAAPPLTLQAIIGHELSHVKDGFSYAVKTRMLPLLGMPALAVGALYLYDKTLGKMQQSGKHAYDKDTLGKALDSASGEMLEEIGVPGATHADGKGASAETDGDHMFTADEHVRRDFVDRSRYLVAAAAGLGAGLMLTRHYSLSAEYRADRLAVKLTGGAEPMIEALETLYKESRKPYEAYLQTQSHHSGLQRAGKRLWETIEGEFMHAHPQFKERVLAMREYAASLSRQGGHLL